MKTSTFINEEQLISKAVDALISKLGPVETNRFLSGQPLPTYCDGVFIDTYSPPAYTSFIRKRVPINGNLLGDNAFASAIN